MDAIEIVLLISGVIMFIGSFFVIEKLSSKEVEGMAKLSATTIEKITEKELEKAQFKIEECLDKILEIVEEKSEREFEKISNEKIIAIHEYSDTVLEEINKNHKEVIFLYSMLCDKQNDLKELTEQSKKSIEQAFTENVSRLKKNEAVRENESAGQNSGMRNEEVFKHANQSQLKGLLNMTQVPEKHFEKEAENKDKNTQNRNQVILEMYKSGKEPVAIARDLNMGYGEVKLVLDLYKGE